MNTQHYYQSIHIVLLIMLFFSSCNTKDEAKRKIINSADKYLLSGNDSIACELYEKAYLIDNSDAYINLEMGNCKLMNNQRNEALEYYNTSIRSMPTKEAYKQRAACYALLKDYPNALKDVQSSINLYPNSANAFSLLSLINYQMGDYYKAVDNLKRSLVLNRNPNMPEEEKTDSISLYRSISTCYMNLQKYDSALYYCNVVISSDSQYYGGYKFRSIIYEKSKNINLAIKDLNHIIDLQPGYSYTYEKLAELYTVVNEKENAHRILKLAKANNVVIPDSIMHYYYP